MARIEVCYAPVAACRRTALAHRFDLVDGLIRVTLSGELTPEDLHALSARILEIERATPAPGDRLIDASQLTGASFTPDDMLAIARARRTQPLGPPVKSALVAPTDVQYGYARMFQMLNDHPEISIEVFRNETDAVAWLASKTPQGT